MNVDVENIIASFEHNEMYTWDPYDGYQLWKEDKYQVHVKKIGKQNLVLFVEVIHLSGDSKFLSKIKAKLHKQTWRFNRKSGEQLRFNEDVISNKLNELMAELILLE